MNVAMLQTFHERHSTAVGIDLGGFNSRNKPCTSLSGSANKRKKTKTFAPASIHVT
jgi:hypothetical protein